jgi:hypothetical protein
MSNPNFPTTFSDRYLELTPDELDKYAVFDQGPATGLRHNAELALATLAHKEIIVVSGLVEADVPQITAIAGQTGVREFCPKDMGKRFPDAETIASDWLPKGRGAFLALDAANDGRIVGYGWTGPELCDELPDCETTFAVRLCEEVAGRGLGAPFTTLIVAGSMALHGAEKIGLETWGSNAAAVRSYVNAGAQLVRTRDSERETQNPDQADRIDGKGRMLRRDTRLYMQFPQTMAA